MGTNRKRLSGPIHGRIRRLRERKGLNLTEFAELVGVHVSVACHWENAWTRPSLSRLPVIAKVLGTTELYLVRDEEAWEPYAKVLRRAA